MAGLLAACVNRIGWTSLIPAAFQTFRDPMLSKKGMFGGVSKSVPEVRQGIKHGRTGPVGIVLRIPVPRRPLICMALRSGTGGVRQVCVAGREQRILKRNRWIKEDLTSRTAWLRCVTSTVTGPLLPRAQGSWLSVWSTWGSKKKETKNTSSGRPEQDNLSCLPKALARISTGCSAGSRQGRGEEGEGRERGEGEEEGGVEGRRGGGGG